MRAAVATHPLQDGVHRRLLLNVKAQEDRVPLHIRQPLHRVQVRRARRVLHFDAHRLGVVHAGVDICLVTGASNGAGLQTLVSISCLTGIHTCIASNALHR